MNVMRIWVTFALLVVASRSPASAATYTWTGGGGANVNWSNPSNWGGSAPGNDETAVELIFPALAAHYASNNDLTGLQVTALSVTTQLSAGNYLFTGNAITLNGPVTMASPESGNPNLVWQIPLALGDDVTISTDGRQTQVQGAIDLGSSTLTLEALGDVVLAGVVSGSGNLIKNNTSALTIRGVNTYSGSTTGNGGALYINNAAALGGTAAGTTFNGGFLGILPGSTFTLSEPIDFNAGGIGAYGAATLAGQVTLNATVDFDTFEESSILTIAGSIVGSGGFNKIGSGLLVLNAPSNLYAGATEVGDGTLQLDAALSSTNPVTVKTGTTLKGSGSSDGPISVENGGTVAPGSSPGRLSSAGLALVAGAQLAVEIDGPDAITQYDTIAVSGPVSLGGATLNLTLGYAPPDGQQFTLISQLQGQPVAGTFAALGEGATFQVGGTTFGITYNGGSGNDVVLVARPPGIATSTATGTTTRTPTTQTQLPTATRTGSATPTSIAVTPTFGATPTASMVPTPTATETTPFCTGDCDGNGVVAINELLIGVNIALDNAVIDACPRFDANGDDRVTIPELIQAVGNALTGCPAVATTNLGVISPTPG